MTLQIALPPEVLQELKADFRQIAREEYETRERQKLDEKLLSPKETCQLFQPNISKVTLHNWSKDGALQKHYIGGRVFYKYSEVMDAAKTLKRYRRF